MTARGEFVEWLRGHRSGLVSGPASAEALEALGLDDATLDRWVAAERVVTSLPHASPNVFFPRVGVAWYARHLQRADDDLVHLRVAVTHVNFSDLGWRPYAWWHVDSGGRLHRETIFTRNKKRKHVVVASRPPMTTIPESAEGVDQEAARLALCGTDLAVSSLLVMATVERAAGLVVPGRTVYLPLPLLVAYAREAADAGSDRAALRWLDGLLRTARGRRIADDGRLVEVSDNREADVLDNPSNIALLAMLGEQGVIGGAKMAGYWPDVLASGAAACRASGAEAASPEMVLLPGEVDYLAHVPPSPGVRAQVEAAEIEYSQGMAVAEHGNFAERIDPFAD